MFNELKQDKMKQVIGVIVYKAFVPDDMDMADINEAFEAKAEADLDRIRISVKNYHDEDEAEPLFDFDSAQVGEHMTLGMG
jgi:hypothetical protein